MLAKVMGAMMGTPAPCTFSGSLSATAVAGTATSSAVTVTVPVGNSGVINISYVDMGTILDHQYKKNSGAFTSFASGESPSFANGDTLTLRTTGDNGGESVTYTLQDNTRQITIQSPVHTGA